MVGYNMSQITSLSNGGGGGSGITTINGDTGSITGSTVTIYADNAANNCGSSVLFVNSGTVSTLNVTDPNLNTLIGTNCGNASIVGDGGQYNTGVGEHCLTLLTSGNSNTCFGRYSGEGITSGSHNTAIGQGSGAQNTSAGTGNDNTSVGYQSWEQGSGSSNTCIGTDSYFAIGSGNNNTGLGYSSGSSYTGAESNNILVGYDVTGLVGESNVIRIGQSNTTGIQLTNANSSLLHNYGTFNTFLGQNAGNFTLTTASATFNVAVGYNAMPAITTGSTNTAIGAFALFSYTGTPGDGNVVVGSTALSAATATFGSTIIGTGAAALVTSTYNLTAIGEAALNNLLTGDSNIAIGQTAGSNYVGAESSNILIGIGVGTVGDNNQIRIGVQGSGDGQQDACQIAGIYGSTVGATNSLVYIDNAGNLGTTSSSSTKNTSILVWGAGQINSMAGIRWGFPSSNAPGGTPAASFQMVMPVAGTISNLYVYVYTNTNTAPGTVTVNQNGANTAIVATITALSTGQFSDTADSQLFSAGDLLQFEMSQSTVGATDAVISCTFTPA